jgi:hypothetical protein
VKILNNHRMNKYSHQKTGFLLVRSDLEREARMMDKKAKARKKRKAIAKDRDFSKNRPLKKKHLTSKKFVASMKSDKSFTDLVFSSKKEIECFLRRAFGVGSRKIAVSVFEKYSGMITIEREEIEIPSMLNWNKPKKKVVYYFKMTNSKYYKDMFNLRKCCFNKLKAFEYTQNFKNSDLRLGYNERVLLVYLENRRINFYHIWEEEKAMNPSLEWEPSLYLSQKTMAEELGWTVKQVRYSMAKLKLYFGKDFFREPTKEELKKRKTKGSWNFQINLPPMRLWNAIIMKKIHMFIINSGDSVLRRRFNLLSYRYLKAASNMTKGYECYMENSMNAKNKEYDRLCKLGRSIRSARQRGDLTVVEYLFSLVFDRTPNTYRKRVPQPIVREYYRKMYKSA